MFKNKSTPILILTLILATILSSRMFIAGDFYFLFDQARDYLLTQMIITTHTLPLIGTHSGLGGFFHGPLWLYILLPVYLIGNGNPFYFTYLYLGLQLGTICASYFIGKKLYGRSGGLILAILLTISPVTWRVVPNTIGVNVEPLIFLGLFYYLIRFIRGNGNSFIIATFFAGITLQFETALPLLLFPAMCIILIVSKYRSNIKILIGSFLAYIISISSFILFDLRHNFLMFHSILNAFNNGQKGKGYLELKFRFFDHLLSLVSVYKSLLFREDLFLILLLLGIIIFSSIKFIKDRNNPAKSEFFFTLFFPVLLFCLFLSYPYPVWPDYVLGLIVPVVIMFYLAIKNIWDILFGKILVSIYFILTSIYILISIYSQYFLPYHPSISAGSFKNQKAVVAWIYSNAGNRKFGYFVYTPETYTHGINYLMWWIGTYNPNAKAESKKDDITYLILYPHLENDNGAYIYWKKNIIKTNGTLLFSKNFTGNILVEKIKITSHEPDVDPNYYQGLLFR